MTLQTMAAIVALAGLSGCRKQDGIYTLYRGSAANTQMRVHVATFDAADGEIYNHGNCLIAAGLFASQPNVSIRYWCEKGRFRS